MWTVAGGRDPDFDDARRVAIDALLRHPDLLRCFRERFAGHEDADFEAVVRELGYVWDCPRDGTANVAGYLCAACGWRRDAFIGERPRARARAPG